MTCASEDVAANPLDLVIERIRRVYRGWNRNTSVAQMRIDWNAAFQADIAPISHQPVSVGGMDGEWIAGSSAPDDKAILYFHGGGFRLGSVSSHRELIARVAGASGCRVLAINYRLAPEHRFPAPLEDTLAAYGWMLDQGLRPENIALAGDSAGGNLVLTTMLGLRERGLPPPAAGADVALDGSGGDRRDLCQPGRCRSDPPAADDRCAGEKLSRRRRQPPRSPCFAAVCRPRRAAAAADSGRRPRNGAR